MAVLERAALVSLVAAASTAWISCGDGDDRPNASCGAENCVVDAGTELEDDDAGSDGSNTERDAGLDAGDGMRAVTIRFKAKLGSEELVCGRTYEGQGKNQVKATPQDFRFYVQEVRLLHKGSKEEERVIFDIKAPFQRAEVALIDFTDGAGQCGGSGGSVVNTTITGKVPAGEYDGVVFVNGVPEELNHAGPAETAGAPLDDVTLFWSWLGGYRFIIAELLSAQPMLDAGSHDAGPADGGTPDASPADGAVQDAGSAEAGADGGGAGGHGGGQGATAGAAFVHIGSTACSGAPATGFSCTRKARNEIRLADFDPSRDTIVADLAAVFKESDLSKPPQCHGIDAPCVAPYAAFGVDMNTGNPSATQQVFRVE